VASARAAYIVGFRVDLEPAGLGTSSASRGAGTSGARPFTPDPRPASGTHSRASSSPLGKGTTAGWWTTYDVPRAVRTAVEVGGPRNSARSGSTAGDLPVVGPAGPGRCSTSWARPRPGSCSPATWTSYFHRGASARLPGGRLRGGPRRLGDGFGGRRTAALVYKLVARGLGVRGGGDGAGGPSASVGKPGRRRGASGAVRHRDQQGTAACPSGSACRRRSRGPLDRGSCSCRWWRGGEVVGRRGGRGGAGAAPRGAGRAAGRYALQLSPRLPRPFPTVFDPNGDEV